jgi:DNA-binding beta-propeller fold protein YncE
VAISADHRSAYVSEFGKISGGVNVEPGGKISIIDLAQMRVRGTIDTAPGRAPHAMRLDQSGQLWVACEETGTLLSVDVAAARVLRSFAVCTPQSRTHMLELLPDDSKLYISSKSDHLAVFDVDEGRVIRRIAVERGTEGIAASPDGTRVVVAENVRQHLLVIDTDSDTVIDDFALLGGVPSSPQRSRLVRLQYSPDGRYLVSANYASGVVHIHDGKDPRQHVMLAVAKGPQGIAFAPDGRRVIVANHDCGVATIVDLEEKRVTGWFEAGNGIETLAFF